MSTRSIKKHTALGRTGQNDRQVKRLGDGGVGHDVVLECRVVPVAGDREETLLDIEDEQEGVILVETLPRHGYSSSVSGSATRELGSHTLFRAEDGRSWENQHGGGDDGAQEVHIGGASEVSVEDAML